MRNIFCLVGMLMSGWIHAGVYSDDLSKCLVESSTVDDRTILVKWMFTSIALHPAAQGMSAVTESQRDAVNKETAALFVKLIADVCVTQAKKAVQYEGAFAIQQAFTVLGNVAGQEIFKNPQVATSLAGLDKYMDKDKLNSALGLPKQ